MWLPASRAESRDEVNDYNSRELPVKLYRSEERLTIAAPLPGLEPQDISVDVTAEGQLVIEGKARGVFKGDKEVLRDEWNAGPYLRRLNLPDPVDATMGNLTYENGIVVLSVPLAGRTTPASLRLERIGSTIGQRIGNAGHPVHAVTMAEHQATRTRMFAGSASVPR
jgi:HSP20 family protein